MSPAHFSGRRLGSTTWQGFCLKGPGHFLSLPHLLPRCQPHGNRQALQLLLILTPCASGIGTYAQTQRDASAGAGGTVYAISPFPNGQRNTPMVLHLRNPHYPHSPTGNIVWVSCSTTSVPTFMFLPSILAATVNLPELPPSCWVEFLSPPKTA